jgi:hypothetical protein
VETWLPLDAPVLRAGLPAPLRAILRSQATRCPGSLVQGLARFAQGLEEHRHRRERVRLQRADRAFARRWSLGGSPA